MKSSIKNWLKSAVFYEIYPTSFYDSNNDGIGDLKGIAQKLDYVADLGCNGIWLNPFYVSEFKDGGYDIVDYYDVDQRFGNLSDAKELFAKARKMGIKIIIDFIPGHTSDKCRWFTESSKPEKNEFSDYYIWTDSVWDDNAGLKMINGAAARNGNYVVNFFAMQPALNYGFANPVRPWQKHYKDKSFEKIHERMIDIMCFWLNAGCDGFRVDMAGSLIKNDYAFKANLELWNTLIKRVKEKYPEAIFVSEWSIPEIAIEKAGFDMDFLIHIGENQSYNSLFRWEREACAFGRENEISCFRQGSRTSLETFYNYFLAVAYQENGFVGIPTGNHDLSRISFRRSPDEIKTAFAFLLTQPSVPFIYYGDEIGMRKLEGLSKDGGFDRTGSRTPMQWGEGKNRDFSTSQNTYLPTDTAPGLSVEAQSGDKNSILNAVKQLAALRRSHPALHADGEIKILSAMTDVPFAYERTGGDEKLIVIINRSGERSSYKTGGVILSSLNCHMEKGCIVFDGCGYAIIKT